MNLYLLRHGIAEERSAGLPDQRRKLTPRGVRRIRQVARGMRALDTRIDLVLTSPYERARRTATIVARALGVPVTVVTDLRPGGDPRLTIRAVRARRGRHRNVLLVGHEPMLSRFVSVLLTGTDTTAITFKKGGLCKLTVTGLRYGKCAALDWFLAPRHMRQGLR